MVRLVYTMGDNEHTTTNRRTVLKTAGALGAVGASGIAGCLGLGGSDSPDSVTFGQPASLTGKWDFLQPAVSQSTDIAIEEINEAGGPLDATVELKRRDTAVDPQEARSVVQQLANNDDAIAILGLFSSEITPLMDFLLDQQLPVVTPWPGSTALDGTGGDHGTPDDVSDDEWVWRTIIGDTVHTVGAGKKMIDEGYDQMGILNGTSQGERSWADAFQNAYENGGGSVVERVEVEEGKSTYQSELSRLFDADIDAWALAVGLEDATTIIREWDEAGYGGQLLVEDGLRDDDLIANVGEEAEGAWLAAATGQGPSYDTFVGRFEDAGDASLHPWGVAAYDATIAVALALHRAGEATPEGIEKNLGPVTRPGGTEVTTFADGKEALDNGDEINFQGAATPVDFTDFGNVFGDVGVEEISPDGFSQSDVIRASELTDLIETY